MNIQAAVRRSRVEGLIAIRDALAANLEIAEPMQAAALAKQLSAVMAELAELNPEETTDAVDEFTRRRAARRTGTDV